MATILQNDSYAQNQTRKNLYNSAEMITLVMGFMFMVMALGGIFDPTFLGLSLTPMHGFILGGCGALAVWSALFRDENEQRAYQINLLLGLFFMANAVAGILLTGATLDRTVVNENLMRRVAPGFLDLTIWDHLMHALAGIWFMLDAFLWKKRNP
ncbi:MAG TPA: hypothetical protein VNJ01_01970 [Bacteriovoracaceae bacterium]|nr:hypothetical protein [Bacteriovoracaceae bacterium]